MDETLQPGDLVVWYRPSSANGIPACPATVVQVQQEHVTILVEDFAADGTEPVHRVVTRDELELTRKALPTGGDQVAKAQTLFEEADERADEGMDVSALQLFQAAWGILPEPKEEQEPAFRIIGGIGDSYFHLGLWHKCFQTFQLALRLWGDVGNPFIRLRLGQCLFEQGDLREATNWMVPAYLQEGTQLFEGEDPKYLTYLKEQLDPPPGGWPEGW